MLHTNLSIGRRTQKKSGGDRRRRQRRDEGEGDGGAADMATITKKRMWQAI